MKLHKKFFSILLAIIAALSLMLCSCGDPAPKGKLYTLEHAYNDGLITIDDFLNIGYFGGLLFNSASPYANIDINYGETHSLCIDLTPTTELNELSDEMRREIATAVFDSAPGFLDSFIERGITKESIINDKRTIKPLGKYNDCYAIAITPDLWKYVLPIAWENYKIKITQVNIADKLNINLGFVGPVGLCIYSYR